MSKYMYLRDKYQEVEGEIQLTLKDLINKSTTKSKTHDTNCIKVNCLNYTELVILHGRLMFVDGDGQLYNLYAECVNDDLLDILMNF